VSATDLAAARAQAHAAQQQVATAEPPFATIACPGAGKTRVIVDRHLTRPVPVRQGRAITSFTRVAAAEVHRRCVAAGRLDLTDHPHFISTLDTFLWLHLVRQFLPTDRIWRRLESWRDAPASSAVFTCGRAYHLADADFSYHPDMDTWSVRPAGAARRGQLPPAGRGTPFAPARIWNELDTSPAPNCARTPAGTWPPTRPCSARCWPRNTANW
jgi:DNA helicase II / ATP-dependent DNA helicase PcrA